jgi:isoleucyl-tRNA synthetase
LLDDQLVSDMDEIREAASVGLSLRKANGLRVRLPLASLTIASANPERLASYADLIADELNVKAVEIVLANEESAESFGLSKRLNVNARTLGPRVGSDVQRIIRESKAGNWSVLDGKVFVDGTELQAAEYELILEAASDFEHQAVGITRSGFVLLNTEVSPILEREGIARDAVRQIQQARRDADLNVSDRITLALKADAQTLNALLEHADLIARETLAEHIDYQQSDSELVIALEKR